MNTDLQPSIIPYREEFREPLTAAWERSVRATHGFLLPEDIDYFKEIVRRIENGQERNPGPDL